LLDASAGGKIKLKTPKEAMELIENMAASDHAILHDRTHIPIKRSLLELTSQDALLAQNKLLAKQLETLIETLNKLPTQFHAVQPTHSTVMQVGGCRICGGAHESGACMTQEDSSKEVNYMANPNRQGFHPGGYVGYQQGGIFLIIKVKAGGHILRISLTKIKGVRPIDLPTKGLICMSGPPN